MWGDEMNMNFSLLSGRCSWLAGDSGARHDDAMTKDQDHRGQLFTSLLARIDQDAS
jgi:hypothetical protein